MKKRDPYFDNVKIVLMLLVVLGHVLPIDLHNKINLATYEWIFSFHMPLFVFISGYFTNIEDKTKFWRGILNFIETFVVFSCIHVAFDYIQGDNLTLLTVFTTPRWTLWYLLSLIWWRLMLYYLPSIISNNTKLLILLSVVLSLAMGFVPINSTFSFQRTFSFLPFFIIGYVMRNALFKNWGGQKIKLLALVVMIAFWFAYYFSPLSCASLLLQKTSYFLGTFNPLLYLLFRAGWLLFASILSLCFLILIPKKEYVWTHFGQMTLFIYMYHSVLLSWRKVLRDAYNLPTNLVYCILYAIMVLIIIWLMSKMKLFHWLLNPISIMLKSRKKP